MVTPRSCGRLHARVRIVKDQITADPSAGLGHNFEGPKINLLLIDRPPEPLDKDVVPPYAPSHPSIQPTLLQHRREVDGHEIRSLVGIEYVGLAIPGKGLLNRLY